MKLLALVFGCDCGQMLVLTDRHDGSICPNCNRTLIDSVVEGPDKLAIFLNRHKYEITHRWKSMWKTPTELRTELERIIGVG